MSSSFRLLMISSLALLFLAAPAAVHADVVRLTDATLEHQTQASTGATTGSWLIMFGAESCMSCTELKPILEELSQDEDLYENGIVLGSLDVNESPNSAMRFSIKTLPTLVYLHKGYLYRFPTNVERTMESLKEFVLEQYVKSSPETIPPPPSPLTQIMDIFNKFGDGGVLLYAFVGLAFILLGTIGALILALCSGGGKTGDESKRRKKSN